MLIRVVCHLADSSGGALCGATDTPILCLPAEAWAILDPENRCPACADLAPPIDRAAALAALDHRRNLN